MDIFLSPFDSFPYIVYQNIKRKLSKDFNDIT